MTWALGDEFARTFPDLAAEWEPRPVRDARLLALNEPLAADLGLDPCWLRAAEQVAVLAGAAVPEGAHPVAQAYAGHQFGHFSGLLGDGRAVLLGERALPGGGVVDVALKGSGRTVFSRAGDGNAVVGPVLRELVVSEAMHALGVPTTRALAAVATGEPVRRHGIEPGAVLTRVAASHLRVGTFELVARLADRSRLAALVDHAIARHHPAAADAPVPALALLEAVVAAQADLVARWVDLGFVHGVMNTDNTTISGETIDYGPCAFVEAYDEGAVFSSIDTGGRYRFGNQPGIATWNLSRLAECLLPLIAPSAEAAVEPATAAVEGFAPRFEATLLARRRARLGLPGAEEADAALARDHLTLLGAQRVDHTLGRRLLSSGLTGEDRCRALFAEPEAYDAWRERWVARLGGAEEAAVAAAMDRANPAYVPRNHLVEEALGAAAEGDLGPVERLLAVVRSPWAERPGWSRFLEPAPASFTRGYVTYCGT